MKKFIIFFIDGVEVIGSDKVCPVDGRFGLARITSLAREKAKSLVRVRPGINGFKIHTGSLLNETTGPLHKL